jgi:hypothetical protein
MTALDSILAGGCYPMIDCFLCDSGLIIAGVSELKFFEAACLLTVSGRHTTSVLPNDDSFLSETYLLTCLLLHGHLPSII